MLNKLRKLFARTQAVPDLDYLQRTLGYRFSDPTLLDTALTHRSYINMPEHEHLPSYERLEFLGDSVLGMCVAEYLVRRFENYSEGELTKLKAGLVNVHSLT